VELTCGGIPEMLAPWFAVVMETYVDVVLTGAGGRSVLARVTLPHELDGMVQGVAAVKWRCQVSWE
jgi:hypothetical protein